MNEDQCSKEMPIYICHKKVHALKISIVQLDSDIAREQNRETTGGAIIHPEDEGYAAFNVDADYVNKHKPEAGGYYVVYKGGYKSFSPAEAFEDGYKAV